MKQQKHLLYFYGNIKYIFLTMVLWKFIHFLWYNIFVRYDETINADNNEFYIRNFRKNSRILAFDLFFYFVVYGFVSPTSVYISTLYYLKSRRAGICTSYMNKAKWTKATTVTCFLKAPSQTEDRSDVCFDPTFTDILQSI